MTKDEWRSIESAPQTGEKVWVKRIFEGQIVKEGWAVFDHLHTDALDRRPLGLDPSADDYAVEAEAAEAYSQAKRWLNPDRMFAFPAPTHWRT